MLVKLQLGGVLSNICKRALAVVKYLGKGDNLLTPAHVGLCLVGAGVICVAILGQLTVLNCGYNVFGAK